MSEGLEGKTPHPGQPTKYKPEYCELLLQHCEEGYTYEAFAGRLRVATQTLYNWEKEHPAFLEAKKAALNVMLYSDQIVLNHGAKGLIENYNAASQIFKMKAVHKWSDKQEVEVNSYNVNNNINTNIDYKKLTDQELEDLDKILSKAQVNPDKD